MKKNIILSVIFILIIMSTTNVFAYNEVPYNFTNPGGWVDYVIYMAKSGNKEGIPVAKKIYPPYELIYDKYDNVYELRNSIEAYEYNFSTNTWKYISNYGGNYKNIDDIELIYSTTNIYWPDGSVFFSGPMGLMEIIQMEVEGIIPAMVGQTLTILPVGFGVLSVMLLIVLLVGFWKFYSRRLI